MTLKRTNMEEVGSRKLLTNGFSRLHVRRKLYYAVEGIKIILETQLSNDMSESNI